MVRKPILGSYLAFVQLVTHDAADVLWFGLLFLLGIPISSRNRRASAHPAQVHVFMSSPDRFFKVEDVCSVEEGGSSIIQALDGLDDIGLLCLGQDLVGEVALQKTCTVLWEASVLHVVTEVVLMCGLPKLFMSRSDMVLFDDTFD